MSLPTNIVEILQAVEDRLVSLKVVNDRSLVIWSCRDSIPHVKGKMDVVLRPRTGQEIQERDNGGGRYDLVCIRNFDVFVRTSFAGSELSTDKAWLSQHVPFEDAILNALAGQMLTDADKNDYLTCPIRYLRINEEKKESSDRPQNLWGSSVFMFEVHFVPKLNLAQLT